MDKQSRTKHHGNKVIKIFKELSRTLPNTRLKQLGGKKQTVADETQEATTEFPTFQHDSNYNWKFILSSLTN